MTKKLVAVLLAVLLFCASVYAQSVYEVKHDEQTALPEVGTVVNGFKVVETRDFDMIGATVYRLEHQKTKATVLYIANDDTNRFFDIAFHTPTEQDTGVPHVFEHAVTDGSEKYPSKELWFNLVYQTYNTYMNAHTGSDVTFYPVGSLSEDQLLALAGFYTDFVFKPSVLEDKSIFDEEAWRYVLKDPDDDLTIAGTVYSEMLGATTRTRKAQLNFLKTIFPGSYAGNDYGGNPDVIPEMTWDDLRQYHGKYYHPSNSLSIIYGKLENWRDFLGLLDSYFSEYDYKEFDFTDYGYVPRNGSVTAEFDFPVEAGSNTANAATVYYGFICNDVDMETLNKINVMTDFAIDESSVLMENLKNALPYGSFTVNINFDGPELVVQFIADNVNADDAQTFKAVVDSSMAQIAEEGFDPAAVDSISAKARISTLLMGDSTNIGSTLVQSIDMYWAGTGDLYSYLDYAEASAMYEKWNNDGSFKEVIRRYVVSNPCWALVTTKAAAGLKEKKDAALAARLAEVKASMSADEIAAIVDSTNNSTVSDVDTAAMVKELQVVDVRSLPEETRIYDIEDVTGDDGIRRIWVDADVTDIGSAGLLLDASGLRQDQLHYYNLWLSLISELDTEEHSRTELSTLMTRYLYNGTIKVSAIEDEITKEMIPRLRVGFIAMDEDMPRAFDLVHELLFDSRFDVSRISDVVSNLKNSLKQAITNSSYNIMIYRAFSTGNDVSAYWNYLNYLDYYDFLEEVSQLLESDPQTVVANLKDIGAYFNNSTDGIILFAGNSESYANYLKTADAFMASLDRRPIEKQVYDLPVAADGEAMIVDSNINYNIIFASNETLGYDKASGDMSAVAALITDRYLLPELRDQRGAYGAYIVFDDVGVYAYSYRDPNIADTYEVYEGLADFVADIEIDQETLDGYILSSYSDLAIGSGELTGAMNAAIGAIGHSDPARVLTKMKQLKTIKAETFAETYTPLMQNLVDNYSYYTSGSASDISKVAYAFISVLNPFGVQDRSLMELSDLDEESPFYDSLRFVFEEGLMAPASDTEFGADLPATLGELAQVMVALLGGIFTQEDSIAYLSQFGIVPNSPVDTTLTVGELDEMFCTFLAAAAGVQLEEVVLTDLAALGLNAEDTATRAALAYEVRYIVVE